MDWLKKRWDIPIFKKIELVDKSDDKLSIREQCELLQLNRSILYYQRKPEFSAQDIGIMEKIDEIYTQRPMYGWPRMTKALYNLGHTINHKKVHKLMKVMGMEAIFPKRNLSKLGKGQEYEVYSYLLKGVAIDHPNQVWGVDITYIRVKKDWLYLGAVMDWFSRHVVSWQLSDSLNSWFCLEVLKQALKVNQPEIHKSDQGVQFTSLEYLGRLKAYPDIKISMDHRGRVLIISLLKGYGELLSMRGIPKRLPVS